MHRLRFWQQSFRRGASPLVSGAGSLGARSIQNHMLRRTAGVLLNGPYSDSIANPKQIRRTNPPADTQPRQALESIRPSRRVKEIRSPPGVPVLHN